MQNIQNKMRMSKEFRYVIDTKNRCFYVVKKGLFWQSKPFKITGIYYPIDIY